VKLLNPRYEFIAASEWPRNWKQNFSLWEIFPSGSFHTEQLEATVNFIFNDRIMRSRSSLERNGLAVNCARTARERVRAARVQHHWNPG